ncbi:hypothetical protein [Microbulbifer hydrolyticus]|uniref:Uncharacterized protein n=1 Tax=Microbulbifer hydrolyticus TaxID=48074 RepID=A0A6P1TIA0_9GAMM|nr:hypothetical protein [Microbulbifer hydrolyticus]MBB5211860.1 hypothetical protein [Microbulbifer hydrolyticus]QHQ40552.1 hypothetical protein GTQ55_17260 [Microbulbifer hydrolyticus]
MLNKTQSISARLSPDDYTYLMSIDRNGAVTQSEKVRELIAMARESVGVESFSRAYLAAGETMLPVKAKYIEQQRRSLIVEALLEIVAEGAAAIQVCGQEESLAPALEQKALPAIEAFMEKILLLALQDEPRVLDPEAAEKLQHRVRKLVHR